MLRTMVMLGVFVLFEFGCVPWEGGGPQLDENVAASGRETNLRVSHLAVELEAGRPVSLCGGSNPKAGAVMAGLKDGDLSVVRVDGSRKMVTVPLPETVMPGTAHVQAAGAFVLVEATVRRLDELGQPIGCSDTDFTQYAFLYDEGLNLLWAEGFYARPHYPLRLDETGGVAILEWTGISFETRYNLPNGTTHSLGDVRIMGGPIARPDAETTLLPVELYATSGANFLTADFAWLEVETGKVKIFHYSGYENWPSVEWQGIELGKRVLVSGDSLWGIARLGNSPILVSNPASLGQNAVQMYVGDKLDQGADLNSVVLMDQAASGWSLFYDHGGKCFLRMRAHGSQFPTLDRLEEPLPEGYVFFKPCKGMGFQIDLLGNVYAIGRTDTHIQVFRILRNQMQWQKVGDAFAGAKDVILEVGAAALRIQALSQGTCKGDAQGFNPADDVALQGDHTQFVGVPGSLDVGEITMITDAAWTSASKNGRCVAMNLMGDEGHGQLFVIDWDDRAKIKGLSLDFDEVAFFN